MSAHPEISLVVEVSAAEEAERAVLSALLMSPSAMAAVRALDLAPADFETAKLGVIFGAMLSLDERGSALDPKTIAAELQTSGKLSLAGGRSAIGDLVDEIPHADNVEHYAEIVLTSAKRRELATRLEADARRLRSGGVRPEEWASGIQPAVDALTSGAPVRARSTITMYDDEELSAMPSIEYTVDGFLPRGALSTIIGAPASYKTFVALDLALHVQLGLEWHGRSVAQGQVVYVYAEGRSGISTRVTAWKGFHGWRGRIGILFVPHIVTVNEPRECAALLRKIEARLGTRSVALIVIDTLNRNMTGNENSTEDMSAFRRGCDTMREATGAGVLAVHHTGHAADDRGRGSSSFEAACDTTVICSRDGDRVTLEVKKQKDGRDGVQLAMEILPVGSSLVLKPSGVAAGKLEGQRLHLLSVLHQNYTAKAGASYSTWLKISALGASSFNKAREWLSANGFVVNAAGKWTVTDSGRSALASTNSTGTLPHSTGPLATQLHSAGGVRSTPAVEWADGRIV